MVSGDFLDRLSSADPVPGGGSVAALQTAMGAALLVMVSGLTIGKKRYQSVQERVEMLSRQAVTARDRAVELAEDDAKAYGEVADVLSLPRNTDAEREYRRGRMQRALKGAVEPPLATMGVAANVLEIARELVAIGNSSAVSDVGSAALAARAGYWAARLNVDINLAAIVDAEWIARIRERLSTIPEPDDAEREIMAATQAVIRGEGA